MTEQKKFRDELMTVPNLLSILRLALVPVFLVQVLGNQSGWALLTLVIASATDYLDGFLARKLNQQTRLGQLLDPAADRLYILATLVGLAVTAHIPVWLPFVIISRDILLATTYPTLAKLGYGPLPVHYLGKAGTFALLYAFPLLLMADVWSSAKLVILPLAWAFAIWGIGLYWWSGYIYVKQLRAVVNSDPSESTRLMV
jgi:cardiolipin synthase